jgi:hypothetical protein
MDVAVEEIRSTNTALKMAPMKVHKQSANLMQMHLHQHELRKQVREPTSFELIKSKDDNEIVWPKEWPLAFEGAHIREQITDTAKI